MDEDGKMYFIEMNTRIQVEHPVTEMVTGIDLVKAQLRIASDEKLSDIVTEPVTIRGHAIECRVNAEHPEKFTPSAGKITVFNVPGGNGVRVDTAQYAEGFVPPYYDSLIAKLIVHGKDRAEAMARMQRSLEMFVVEGIHTTIPLHQKIFADAEFREGRFDTKFMERFFEREKARLDGVAGLDRSESALRFVIPTGELDGFFSITSQDHHRACQAHLPIQSTCHKSRASI